MPCSVDNIHELYNGLDQLVENPDKHVKPRPHGLAVVCGQVRTFPYPFEMIYLGREQGSGVANIKNFGGVFQEECIVAGENALPMRQHILKAFVGHVSGPTLVVHENPNIHEVGLVWEHLGQRVDETDDLRPEVVAYVLCFWG